MTVEARQADSDELVTVHLTDTQVECAMLRKELEARNNELATLKELSHEYAGNPDMEFRRLKAGEIIAKILGGIK